MAEIVPFADFLNKRIDFADKKIAVLIEDTEEIVGETICDICEYILYDMADKDAVDTLKDLRASIDDWFDIQEKKKGL